MSIDLATVRRLFEFLHKHMKKDDLAARAKCFANYKSLAAIIQKRIVDNLAKVQSAEVERIRAVIKKDKTGKLVEEMEQLTLNTSNAINRIASFQALVMCTLQSFKQQLNGCQEHATLIVLAFMKLYGINQGPLVECIKLDVIGTGDNHGLVVMGRDEQSTLSDVSRWGNNCLAIDSWGNWIATLDKLPEETALKNLLQFREFSGLAIEVPFDNRMGLNHLSNYKTNPSSLFHQFEQCALQNLSEELIKFVDTSFAAFNMPPLGLLPSTKDAGIFAVVNLAPSSTDSPNVLAATPIEDLQPQHSARV
ncbi:hypothetical protein [Legionella cardiaca]|uniref:Uncharacterized protein n=1 Tax=Legionella cardiaca TaxID=1071983 RepID=A0ABY8AQE9_9GAMM|nr:hypothetical protein [Legionella cardiaca]WED42918.1 hypothetical protein PXX05_13600 [Legionella cardiaca]